MTSERECFVYTVPPGATEFVTAGRFRWDDDGSAAVGRVRVRALLPEAGRCGRARSGRVAPLHRRVRDGAHAGLLRRHPGFHARLLGTARDRAQCRSRGTRRIRLSDAGAGRPRRSARIRPERRASRSAAPVQPHARACNAPAGGRCADRRRSGARRLGRASAEELRVLGTSMGGARPKTVVQDDQGLWIAKFGRNDDRWNHPRVEHGMLTLARARGLDFASAGSVFTDTSAAIRAGTSVSRPGPAISKRGRTSDRHANHQR